MKRALAISALVATVFSVVISLAIPRLMPTQGTQTTQAAVAATTDAYDRIIKSGTIRVGYVPVALACDVDPKTGKVSGMFVDILNEMAKNMGLKVEFAEEVGWGTMIAGLQTGRYDMMASPVWPNSSRAKQATFSKPVYYSAIGVWVRQSEDRFSPASAWGSLNDPKVRIGALDGSTGETIALTQFPNATLNTYPELTSEAQAFLDVSTGKIDVFFEEPAKGMLYVANNPGQIKNIAADQPVKVFANVFLLPAQEYRLQEMINTALEEVQNSGFVDRVLSKYEPAPNSYYRTASPYRSSQ
jgi:polar amino acid transport system substrate-binding protein